MIAWLQVNWLWLLLGVGLLWFFARRGGCCGMGGHNHGAHEEHSEQSAIGAGKAKVTQKRGGCC